jgi:broad specificity phosphatase PhoE
MLSHVLQSAGLENLQEELQIPNHRVPLSANGVQQSFAAGELVHELLHDAHDHHQQQQHQQNGHSASSCSSSSSSRASSKVFMYTSPFLRCIQTAQHVVRALKDEQVRVAGTQNCSTNAQWVLPALPQVPGQLSYHIG